MERIRVTTHEDIVQAELAAIDARMAEIEKRTKGAKSGAHTYLHQELRTELGRLRMLRSEIEGDLEKPIQVDRNGNPLTERDYGFCRCRTLELKDHKLAAAAKFEREGDHRNACRCRHDALRARHVAEYEMHWRPSLRGFTFPG